MDEYSGRLLVLEDWRHSIEREMGGMKIEMSNIHDMVVGLDKKVDQLGWAARIRERLFWIIIASVVGVLVHYFTLGME